MPNPLCSFLLGFFFIVKYNNFKVLFLYPAFQNVMLSGLICCEMKWTFIKLFPHLSDYVSQIPFLCDRSTGTGQAF